MDNPLLKATGICKSFKTGSSTINVLEGVNLDIKKGERVIIIGASGAGKSTLLHILGTLETPDKGSLSLNGEDLLKIPTNRLSIIRNKQIGFVFQFHHLLAEFDALENVSIPGYVYSKDWKGVQARAEEVLVYVGLKDRLHHKPHQLSGGEQQRVAIARALINNPSLILMDEPTGDLDEKNADILVELISKLVAEKQQTVVIVTHNIALCKGANLVFELKGGILHLVTNV
jgi:lipoprotein-releasing system ATP-binding protein